jgi:NDP-sugar pyrophosphorylase family protein
LKEEGEVLYIHPSIVCNGIDLGANTVIEKGCVIGENSSLQRSILLPGAKVEKGSSIENAIIGPDYVVRLDKPVSSSLPPIRIIFEPLRSPVLGEWGRV